MVKFHFLKNNPVKIIVLILSIAVLTVAVFIVVKAVPTYISDTFSDETKIGKGTQKVNIDTVAGEVTLQECYTADPSWTKVADTTVRDIDLDCNNTIAKDIYCDGYNCILYTDGEVPSNSVCIATDSDVYANILWSKTNSTSKPWGNYGVSLSGDDIGGTHGNKKVGDGGLSINAKNWLERYYISDAGTYTAMDECKSKGSGWRLPTILELDSIRDQAKGSAPYTYLPDIVSRYYWSSTEDSSSGAYSLAFGNGSVGYYKYKTTSNYVRCVRGQ